MNLIRELYNQDCIKIGNFVLKSGQESNIYIDLRKIMGNPKLLNKICLNLSNLIECDLSNTIICGVPTGALCYATNISQILNIPMILVRYNKKKYGLKKQIEGLSDDEKLYNCILIEDVVTTGGSCLEVIDILEKNNINVIQIISVISREKNNKLSNYNFKSLLDIENILKYSKMLEYKNKLVSLINNKESNIIFSADLDNPQTILDIIETVGEHIVGVKLHLDTIIYNNSISKLEFYEGLQNLKDTFNLFLIEDRKLSDIGYIMNKQAKLIPDFIDMITTHSVTGFKSVASIERPILLLHSLSTDSLCDNNYKNRTLDMAYNLPNIVGLVTQDNIPDFLIFTPGINLDVIRDTQGQRYKGPRYSDFYIIGRAIYKSSDPLQSVLRYKEVCYNTYNKKINNKL